MAAIVGYYGSWAAYRGVTPEVLDPSLCTHLIYAFVGMEAHGTIKFLDRDLDYDQRLFRRVTDLKESNPNLKVLVSVGGANPENSTLFRSISADLLKKNTFVMSVLTFLQNYKFDGLDIDWEYPTGEDRNNFILLLEELKCAFQRSGLLLTVAVASSPKEGYDVPKMISYVDFLNVMTYDFYGSWSNYTGQNSALYPSSVESEWEKANLNIVAAAANWVSSGAPKSKLAIGTSFYGRSFTLKDPNESGLHAPICGAGSDGETPLYSKICNDCDSWTRVWDSEQKSPYKNKDTQWIGYDDLTSIWYKGDWIKSQGFFGAMVWTIDGDDVNGKSGKRQALLKELNRALR